MDTSQYASGAAGAPGLELRRGDHIRVDRGLYHHDGIYLGNGQVIHLASSTGSGKAGARVQIGDIRDFANGRVTVRRYQGERDPEETIARAMSRLGDGEYNLAFNNCQHFARWCVTGNHFSEQVEVGTALIGGMTVPVAVGHVGVNGVVSSAGRVNGLSGPGIMSGLAQCGSLVGGGAVEGMVLLAALSGLAAVAIMNTTALRHDDDLPEDELRARAAGRVGGVIGAVAGTAGGIAAVSHMGVPGLSGSGITSGLAAIGAWIGGGMTRGTFCVIAVPVIAAAAGAYLAWRLAGARRAVKPADGIRSPEPDMEA